MNPLVSVILVSHNRAHMVTRAMDSVYAQTYRPLELLVVDDGSTDNSWEVISDWQKTHPDGDGFYSDVRTFPNGGIAASRIRGLEMAQGEFVQYVDDDDWLAPDCIAAKMELFRANPQLDVVVHQMTLLGHGGRNIGRSNIALADAPSCQLEHLLDVNTETLIVPVLMMRKSAMLAVGGWTPGLNFAEDMDIVFRMAANGACFALVDRELSFYNMHGGERLCTTLFYNLPDDFWTNFWLKTWEFCRVHGHDDSRIADKIAQSLVFYGLRWLRQMRFDAAENCFDAAQTLGGGIWFYGLPRIVRKPWMWLYGTGYCLYGKMRNVAKRLLKR